MGDSKQRARQIKGDDFGRGDFTSVEPLKSSYLQLLEPEKISVRILDSLSLESDNVVAVIDKMDFTGDAACQITGEIESGVGNIGLGNI